MRSRSHGWMCNRRPSGSLEERGIEPARRRYGAVDNTLVMCRWGGGQWENRWKVGKEVKCFVRIWGRTNPKADTRYVSIYNRKLLGRRRQLGCVMWPCRSRHRCYTGWLSFAFDIAIRGQYTASIIVPLPYYYFSKILSHSKFTFQIILWRNRFKTSNIFNVLTHSNTKIWHISISKG